MTTLRRLSGYCIVCVRWLVRGLGPALFAMCAAGALRGSLPGPFELAATEPLLMIGLLLTLAGVLLAFWNQMVGGAAMLAGMAAFAGEPQRWFFRAFVITGALNIVCWCMQEAQKTSRFGAKKEKNANGSIGSKN